METKENKGFGEKAKRGRPSKASKIANEETEELDDENMEDGEQEDGSFEQGIEDSLKQTTVNVPNSNGDISTEDIDFSNEKGFNDIPDEEFDLLGESTVNRAYASGGGGTSKENTGASAVSEEVIPEPNYTNSTQTNSAGFKNEFTDKGYTENGQAQTSGQNKEQAQAEKDKIKAEKEQQKANSNVKDLTPEQKKEAAAKTSKMAVEAYSTYKPLPFIYFSSYDQKKLEKDHENNEIDLEGKIKQDGTTLGEFVQEFNSNVAETFKVKEDTKSQLEDALYDVLMEKDIALTPTQRLVGVLALDVVGSIVATFKLRGQMKSDMEEIKLMHAQTLAEIRKTAPKQTAAHYNQNPQPAPSRPQPAASPQPEPVKPAQPASVKKEQPEVAITEVNMSMDDILNAEIKPELINAGDIPLSETEEISDNREDEFHEKE